MTRVTLPPIRPSPHHPLSWLLEPLTEDPSFITKRMFGSHAVYLHGRLMLALFPRGDPPWNGILVATDRRHHASLQEEFTALTPHSVLGKWLHLRDDRDDFEQIAEKLIERVLADDLRFGVTSKQLRTRKRAPSVKKTRSRSRKKR